jgi:hypothetical protein
LAIPIVPSGSPATASSSRRWLVPVISTCPPSAAIRWAVASPMPLLPPVMTTFLPVKRMIRSSIRAPDEGRYGGEM